MLYQSHLRTHHRRGCEVHPVAAARRWPAQPQEPLVQVGRRVEPRFRECLVECAPLGFVCIKPRLAQGLETR